MKTVNEIVSVLSEQQQQLLKDTINKGYFGNDDQSFVVNGEEIEDDCDVYVTNDAKRAGHFKGREISSMFKSIYSKLCPFKTEYSNYSMGEVISHCSNWWGDNTGDALFIRREYSTLFEEWAKQ